MNATRLSLKLRNTLLQSTHGKESSYDSVRFRRHWTNPISLHTKLLLALAAILPTVGLADDVGDCYEEKLPVAMSFVDISILGNPEFRGYRLGNDGFRLGAELSTNGISLGVRIDTSDLSGGLGSLSYSYATESMILSAGINYIDYSFLDQEIEVFLEFSGREDFFGMTPSLMYAFGMGNGGGDYAELRFSKDFYFERIVWGPYLELGGGDFYTNSWEVSHVRIGGDVSLSLGERWSLSGHAALVARDSELENLDGERGDFVEGGVTLSAHF